MARAGHGQKAPDQLSGLFCQKCQGWERGESRNMIAKLNDL